MLGIVLGQKVCLECSDEVTCGGILFYWDDFWPVSEGVNENQELFPSISTVISWIFLKGSKWFRFLNQWFFRV